MFGSILLMQAGSSGSGGGDEEEENENEEEENDEKEEEEEDVKNQKKTGGSSRDELIMEVASTNLSKIPDLFDMEECALSYPIKWEESMNTVITQELERFNALRNVIVKSLNDIQKAVKGVVVMSEELEKVGDALYYGKVRF